MKKARRLVPATLGLGALAVGALGLGAIGLVAAPAAARVTFGDNDVRTIFYVSKSDDRNRVDYGIRLDERCMPLGDRPVYAYWHRFEPGQPRYGDLNGMDRRAYGIQRQSVRSRAANGSWIELRLRGFRQERLLVLVQRDAAGSCHARAQVRIARQAAFLDHIHVQLHGPMRIDYVLLEGRDARTGAEVSERRQPPRGAMPRFGG